LTVHIELRAAILPHNEAEKETLMMAGAELRKTLLDVLGEEGCGVACEEADIFEDEQGWKLNLCGFMEPWQLGKTDAEAETSLRDLASMRFGMS
jgi:hypothetical protein